MDAIRDGGGARDEPHFWQDADEFLLGTGKRLTTSGLIGKTVSRPGCCSCARRPAWSRNWPGQSKITACR